eukprot:1460134-Pleurochrysis_carterae.AAC.1
MPNLLRASIVVPDWATWRATAGARRAAPRACRDLAPRRSVATRKRGKRVGEEQTLFSGDGQLQKMAKQKKRRDAMARNSHWNNAKWCAT